MHGLNVVNKLAPYTAQAWGFDDDDAALRREAMINAQNDHLAEMQRIAQQEEADYQKRANDYQAASQKLADDIHEQKIEPNRMFQDASMGTRMVGVSRRRYSTQVSVPANSPMGTLM